MEEEIDPREYAKSLIMDACAKRGFFDENGKGKGLVIKLNNGKAVIKLIESEIGEIGFSCEYDTETGKGDTRFSPQPYVEKLVSVMAGIVKEDTDLPELTREVYSSQISDITDILIDITIDELWQSIHFLPNLAQGIHEFLSSNIYVENKGRSLKDKENIVDQLLKRSTELKKIKIMNREKAQRELEEPPQFVFCVVYDFLHSQFKLAKALYTKNKRSNKALDFVKLEFPDLPEVFVDQFSDPDPYAAKPSSIALQCTAWFLNVSSGKAAIRTLEQYLKESREQRKSVSEADLFKAFDTFLIYPDHLEETRNKVMAIIREKYPNPEDSVLLEKYRKIYF